MALSRRRTSSSLQLVVAVFQRIGRVIDHPFDHAAHLDDHGLHGFQIAVKG